MASPLSTLTAPPFTCGKDRSALQGAKRIEWSFRHGIAAGLSWKDRSALQAPPNVISHNRLFENYKRVQCPVQQRSPKISRAGWQGAQLLHASLVMSHYPQCARKHCHARTPTVSRPSRFRISTADSAASMQDTSPQGGSLPHLPSLCFRFLSSGAELIGSLGAFCMFFAGSKGGLSLHCCFSRCLVPLLTPPPTPPPLPPCRECSEGRRSPEWAAQAVHLGRTCTLRVRRPHRHPSI